MNFIYDYEDYKEIKKVTEIIKGIEEINKIKYKNGYRIKEEKNTESFTCDTSIWVDNYVRYEK